MGTSRPIIDHIQAQGVARFDRDVALYQPHLVFLTVAGLLGEWCREGLRIQEMVDKRV